VSRVKKTIKRAGRTDRLCHRTTLAATTFVRVHPQGPLRRRAVRE
jgi:hypothetical protein